MRTYVRFSAAASSRATSPTHTVEWAGTHFIRFSDEDAPPPDAHGRVAEAPGRTQGPQSESWRPCLILFLKGMSPPPRLARSSGPTCSSEPNGHNSIPGGRAGWTRHAVLGRLGRAGWAGQAGLGTLCWASCAGPNSQHTVNIQSTHSQHTVNTTVNMSSVTKFSERKCTCG